VASDKPDHAKMDRAVWRALQSLARKEEKWVNERRTGTINLGWDGEHEWKFMFEVQDGGKKIAEVRHSWD
jgi:hypothetical protein